MSTLLTVVFRGSSVKSSSFVEKNIKHHSHKHHHTAAVHWLMALDAETTLHTYSDPGPAALSSSLHSSGHCTCPQLDTGESRDDFETVLLVFECSVCNYHHCSFKDISVQKGFHVLCQKSAALNEASVASCDFFTSLVKKDCCLPKAAFNSHAFSVRNVLPGG